MGTMLYGKGVFINRCFESLNQTQPELVVDVHGEYLKAGADVIESNTFGANRMKLRGFGLGDQVREINLAGAQLARRAVEQSKGEARSEEHTSELQSQSNLVCRLLLEKKNMTPYKRHPS